MNRNEDIAGSLTIHAQAMRHAEHGLPDTHRFLFHAGHAWLEYRSNGTSTTFSKVGDFFRRDAELGLSGEATRSTTITHAQERLLFRSVARRTQLEEERGFNSCTSSLDSARFAALIWRIVTKERLHSTYRGLFNPSTLADSIERLNTRDRFIGLDEQFREVRTRVHRREQERERET